MIKNQQKMDPKSIKIGIGAPQSRLGGVQEASWRQDESITKVRREMASFGSPKRSPHGAKIDLKNDTIFDACQNLQKTLANLIKICAPAAKCMFSKCCKTLENTVCGQLFPMENVRFSTCFFSLVYSIPRLLTHEG